MPAPTTTRSYDSPVSTPRGAPTPSRNACALSNDLALPIAGSEHYVLAAGTAGTRDERGWETDLLAGLNVG